MVGYIYILAGFRNFANRIFANCWRIPMEHIDESPLNFRQLANFHGTYWRIPTGRVEDVSVGVEGSYSTPTHPHPQ